MHIRNLTEAERLLDSFVPRPLEIKKVYNLNTVRALVAAVGSPQERVRTIHVAGTSGKTSTCYFAAELIRLAGHTVGLTVSPHLVSVTERVQINGQPIDARQFCDELGVFMDMVYASALKPTYFELMMVFALWEFDRCGVDFAVVEVGMGGTWDASNILQRPDKICVITDIGIDHTRMLGETVAEIAPWKAGIIHAGNHVYMHEQQKDVMNAVRQRIHEVGGALHVLSGGAQYDDGLRAMPTFQQRNASLAVASVNALFKQNGLSTLTAEQVSRIATYQVPGRMEIVVAGDREVLLDGAHNPQKLTALSGALRSSNPAASRAMVFGMLSSKGEQLTDSVAAVASFASVCIVVASLDGHALADPDIVSGLLKDAGVHVLHAKNIEDAVRLLIERSEDELVVTGSLYLVGAVKRLLATRS